MIIYILNLVIVVLVLSYGVNNGTYKKNELGETYIEPQKYALFACCFVLIFVYAARGATGTDTPGYISGYNRMISRGFYEIIEEERDWLFFLITYIDRKIFGINGIIYHNTIIGVLAYIPVIYVYKKYSGNIIAAVFLYIVTSAYYFAFNGQRQGVAIGIMTLGYPFLLRRKYVPWIIISIIASFFHTTAYLMIPLGLLLMKETTSKQFIIISSAALISAFLLWSIWNSLFEMLGMMGQDKIVHDYGNMTEETSGGANPIRVVIAAIPVILGIIYYKRMKSKKFQLILNYSIWQVIFIVASTKNVFLYRCSSYFAPIQILIFIEISKVFDERSKKIYWTAVSVLYLAYMYISLKSEGGMLPYQLFGKYRFY